MPNGMLDRSVPYQGGPPGGRFAGTWDDTIRKACPGSSCILGERKRLHRGSRKCIRSPPDLLCRITARTSGTRVQVIVVAGGSGSSGQMGVNACADREPHGFVEQEAEVAAGIARFVAGSPY